MLGIFTTSFGEKSVGVKDVDNYFTNRLLSHFFGPVDGAKVIVIARNQVSSGALGLTVTQK